MTMTIIDKRRKSGKESIEKGEMVGELGSRSREEVFGWLPRLPEEVSQGFLEGQVPRAREGTPEEGYR